MNRLSTAKRARILSLLVEGTSMRSIERHEGVSINTIAKLLDAAGKECHPYRFYKLILSGEDVRDGSL